MKPLRRYLRGMVEVFWFVACIATLCVMVGLCFWEPPWGLVIDGVIFVVLGGIALAHTGGID